MGSLTFKIWPFLNLHWMMACVWQVLLLLSLNFVYWMVKKGISNHGLSSHLDEWEKPFPESKEGGDEICSLTQATVTATTKRWKLSSPSFSKKVSGVHFTVGFFLVLVFFSYNGKVKGRQNKKMKTSVTEHLEQQQQTKSLFTLTTNKKKSDTAAFQGGSNSSLTHPM